MSRTGLSRTGLLRRPLSRRRWWVIAGLLVALAVAGGLVIAPRSGQITLDGVATGDRNASVDSGEPAEPETQRPAESSERPAESSEGSLPAESDDAADVAATVDSESAPDLGALEQADPERRLIREGSVTVGYGDTFEAAYRQVAELARRHGGGVLDLESSTDDEGVTRGAITVEVPVGDYDAVLEGVGDVGPVLRRDVRTEDVTEEYVDLRSRLRHLERTEQFFLDLFDEAETVDEAITIRDRLDSVQPRIEEIEGRLRRLEERTEMSRLTVELVPEGEEPHGEPPAVAGFADYWDDAREAFVGVAGTLLVVAVGGAPLALAGAVALAVVAALVRAWRSASAAGAE